MPQRKKSTDEKSETSDSFIHQPTDKLFKKVFEQPQVMQELIESQLPKKILQSINFSTLKLEKGSFINSHFRAKETDMLYSVLYNDKPLFLYLLIEMQTTVDDLLMLRLMGYLHCFFDRFTQQHPKQSLPLIYPMVIYAGDKPWDAPLNFFDLFASEKRWARLILAGNIPFIDIHRLSDDTIEYHRWLGLFKFVVKYRKVEDKQDFLKRLFAWLNEIELHNGHKYSNIILNYVFNQIESHNEKFFFEIAYEALTDELKGEIMTLEQSLILRGQQRGIQQGIQQGFQRVINKLIKKGLDKKQVASLIDLDINEIEKLLNLNYEEIEE